MSRFGARCRQLFEGLHQRLQSRSHQNESKQRTSFCRQNPKDEPLDKRYMPDPLEHATGLEKRQMIRKLMGDDDPFDIKCNAKGLGTRDCPKIVYSPNPYRMVGCHCHPVDCHIVYMWLSKDEPRRCQCGYWHKLEHKDPV